MVVGRVSSGSLHLSATATRSSTVKKSASHRARRWRSRPRRRPPAAGSTTGERRSLSRPQVVNHDAETGPQLAVFRMVSIVPAQGSVDVPAAGAAEAPPALALESAVVALSGQSGLGA